MTSPEKGYLFGHGEVFLRLDTLSLIRVYEPCIHNFLKFRVY